MTSLIFIWFVLTAPADRYVCTLWVSLPPTADQLAQACPEAITAAHRLHVYNIEEGERVCSIEGWALMNLLENCNLEGTLDLYRIVIVEPNFQETVCAVVTETEVMPSAEQIIEQCPQYNSSMRIQFAGSRADPDPVPVCQQTSIVEGTALTQTPASPALLATDTRYTWLGGRLIWHGIAKPLCEDGLSGIDPATGAASACGMDGAIPQVIEWQNRYDQSIWDTSQTYGVPAVMLKSIMGVESQFWPLWEPSSESAEIGMAQVTLDGLDVPLRYDQDLAAQICPIAFDAARCDVSNYPGLSADEQLTMRYVLRTLIAPCTNCLPIEAAWKVETDMHLYARILRAYRCYAAETTGTTGDAAWFYAAAAYHAGGTCIANGSICEDGQNYLIKLESVK